LKFEPVKGYNALSTACNASDKTFTKTYNKAQQTVRRELWQAVQRQTSPRFALWFSNFCRVRLWGVCLSGGAKRRLSYQDKHTPQD